jgi:5,10-methylenetetrahydromethanopterin reductase
VVELARVAEAAGVDSIWVAEGPVARDAFVTLTAIACATSRVELGTGVVNPFTRHPAQLAASVATLDEAAGGRAICGLGIGARDYLIPLAFDVSKPLTTAREMLELVRRLLRREVVELDGVKFRVDAVRLGFKPARSEIPIYLAATGPKMCALAGEQADGIYLLYGTRSYIEGALRLAATDRPQGKPFAVASPILMAVDDDPEAARQRVKPGIGLILTEPNGEEMLEANGLDPAFAQRIRAGLADSGIRGLAAAVDDQIVDKLAIAGSAATCLERLGAAVEWGVTEPQVLLAGDDPKATLRVLEELKRVAA